MLNFFKSKRTNPITFDTIYAAYMGFTIGDALGVPVEFLPRNEVKKNPITDMIGGGFHHREPGIWSDDTSLMLATSAAISNYGFTPKAIAQEMIAWMDHGKYSANGEMFGIGNGTRKSLERIKAGYKAIKAGGKGIYENGNGSLMRILPLIFFLQKNNSFAKRKKIIYDISSITHQHNFSKVACHFFVEMGIKVLAGISFGESYKETAKIFLQYYGNIEEFKRIFQQELSHLGESEINSGTYVIDTLEAVIWCLGTTNTYTDAVLKAVNLGNDADTIGALTGGLAGILYGIESIPEKWQSQIVNCEFLKEQAKIAEKSINK